MSIDSVMPSNHLILCCPLLLLPPIFPSIRVFSNESAFCISWPKHWGFSFNISLSNEHSGLISLRMDWLDPCSPRDSQESSPTPQFKSINSSNISPRCCQIPSGRQNRLQGEGLAISNLRVPSCIWRTVTSVCGLPRWP